MIGNDEFQLDCKQNSFVFIKDECAGKVYTVTIKLTNLDGSYWAHEIALKGYVPVEKIDTYLTKYSLYNPNTISYVSKDLSDNDPTVFGMKVEINKDSGRLATYNFENCGKVIVFVNGVNENEMVLKNGLLTVSNPNSLILPMSFKYICKISSLFAMLEKVLTSFSSSKSSSNGGNKKTLSSKILFVLKINPPMLYI